MPPPSEIIRTAAPVADEIQQLTAGTGLAIVLRSYGLALRPEKNAANRSRCGIVPIDSADDTWPIGWESEIVAARNGPDAVGIPQRRDRRLHARKKPSTRSPRDSSCRSTGTTPRSPKHKIDPATIQVHLPRTRTYYKRILDRVLAQAHLAGKVRVDEAGTAFLWISK